MSNQFLNGTELPFCKGCGHSTISNNTEKALQKLNLSPLDVIMVTDIGCHGIIDKNFLTHTVHGLHGRSVALAAGVSAGINNPDKKVIVFIGDGGATIGMQHLIDAAHNNFNMTVVIHNNMLYGMTGGQPSEFTPQGFKTPTLPEGAVHKGYDICSVLSAAGAGYAARLTGIGDFSDQLAEAFSKKGFSLIEVMEICPSYGVKSNPGMKLREVAENAGLQMKVYSNIAKESYHTNFKDQPVTLFPERNNIVAKYSHSLEKDVRIMLCGSAGEGVQATAELFARAAMLSGLNVTKKGSYPVTVGIGFSAAEIIVSPIEILYTGSPDPDVMIVVSQEGLDYGQATAKNMSKGILFLDSALKTPEIKSEIIKLDFRSVAGSRNACIAALFKLLTTKEIFSIEAMKEIFLESKISKGLELDRFLKMD